MKKMHTKEPQNSNEKLYVVSAVLEIQEYIVTDYMALNKSELKERFDSIDRNGFRVIKLSSDIGFGFNDYFCFEKLYQDICEFEELSRISMER